MLADTASMHPWIIPVLPDPTVTPLDRASSWIVDEVGASLPGRSVGLSWRFGHVQIHTGNLLVIIHRPGDLVPKPIQIQVMTLHVES